MAIDAMEAGKDVYCEKPMTKHDRRGARGRRYGRRRRTRSMTVGVQSMADPTWRAAHEYIAAGNIGQVLQGQTSYYRNCIVGQWRYYPLTKEMSPKTIDWDMWLGHKFRASTAQPLGPTPKEMPFDRAVWAQWRCYWPFGGGMFTDLFVHQTTHLISAMGVRYPGPRGRRRRHLPRVRRPRRAGRGHRGRRLRRGLPVHHLARRCATTRSSAR